MSRTPPRTALVTGGGKRIGRAIVEDLAANGFAVAIHANSSTREAERLAAEIRGNGGRAEVLAADLTRVDDTERLVDAAAKAVGPLGLLVNSASIFKDDDATPSRPTSGTPILRSMPGRPSS